MTMVCYSRLKKGARQCISLGRQDAGRTNIACAMEVMPVDPVILQAMEWTEQGMPEQAIHALQDLRFKNLLASLEYSEACFQALYRYTASIATEPDNPDLYQARATIHFLLNDASNAWNDIGQARKRGGQIDPRLLQALSTATGREK